MKRYLHILFVAMFAIMSFTIISCEDDKDETNSEVKALIGTWSYSGMTDEDGYMTSSLTFKSNGKCIVKETFQDDPEYNYSVTVNYSVTGSFDSKATIKMWGKDADGDDMEQTWIASITGNRLSITDLEGNTLILIKD